MVNRYFWGSALMSLLSGASMVISTHDIAAGATLAFVLLTVLMIVEGAAVTIVGALKE